jgi:hypothetical protein
MLHLIIKTPKSNTHGDAELFIDYQDESVGFTVVTKNGSQYDFSCDIQEWEQLKDFIDKAIQIDIKNNKIK